MTDTVLPTVKKHYQNVFIESERWNAFTPRNDDIIITTSYKAGTTWVQGICAALVFQSAEPPGTLDDQSPWLDALFEPVEDVIARLDAIENRRYLKTHLPLDAIPYQPSTKYIFVGRDGRDVWMSMWNHWNNMQPAVIEGFNNAPSAKGPKLPLPPEDINAAFDDWLAKSPFAWERDGYPFWSHHYHAQTWWDFRHLDNILFVHFADLLQDLDGQMRRISSYLDIPVDESIWPDLVHSVTFDQMKSNADKRAPGADKGLWKDTKNFFHKGTNRRWEGVLTDDQLRRYEALMADLLEPGLARWLVHADGFPDTKET